MLISVLRQALNVRHNAMKTLIIISTLLFCFSANGQKSKTLTNRSKALVDSTYIPVDLDDCLKQVDSMFADSVKTEIKALTENEFSSRYHFGFGMWMRNNWGLWKGSRLSKYFNSLGVYHPDDMTGIIFGSYHRQLTGQERKLGEQIKYYQDYWEKAKKNDLERKNNEFANYSINDTVIYKYRSGFISKDQEKKYDNDECNAKGIITDKQDSTFSIKVRLLDACSKMGIISYDNKGSLVLNKTTKKLEKPKKRVIEYMKPDQEVWFNYSDWKTND